MESTDRWEYKAILATKFWSDGYTTRGEGDIAPPANEGDHPNRGHGFRNYYTYSTETLNSLGEEGWELVSATPIADKSHDYYFVFKRKLPPGG